MIGIGCGGYPPGVRS